jgi:hypothetical protein
MNIQVVIMKIEEQLTGKTVKLFMCLITKVKLIQYSLPTLMSIVVGKENDQAIYWKNNQAVNLKWSKE